MGKFGGILAGTGGADLGRSYYCADLCRCPCCPLRNELLVDSSKNIESEITDLETNISLQVKKDQEISYGK